MIRSRVMLLVAAGLPPLLLAVIGLTHPTDLTPSSAAHWRDLHIALLPLFPLLALGPWLVARRVHPLLGQVVAVLGYVYAAAYTALDVLAGVGAGALQADGRAESTSTMFAWGNALAEYGVWAYFLATVLAAAAAVRRRPRAAAPGALLALIGASLFIDNHIYWPVGVLSMLALAFGWTLLMHAVTAEQAAPAVPAASAEPITA